MLFAQSLSVSTHSRPKAAVYKEWCRQNGERVSTHSRPKAAVRPVGRCRHPYPCFNTQPPEGGWLGSSTMRITSVSFNTQPPEGGCRARTRQLSSHAVSTHSRPKAAGNLRRAHQLGTHVSTHSRPKAAAKKKSLPPTDKPFQHTAARRRLQAYLYCAYLHTCFNTQPPEGGCYPFAFIFAGSSSFNTQPPEGG